ncbi:MAG: flavin reductase family protein [Actinomycetaceae bacterium]|nr:flavin reductase family protein [Actinomycetaceae bacterium]
MKYSTPSPHVDRDDQDVAAHRELRRAFGHFPSGVTVVSYAHGNAIYGITVSSFTSISLDPPLVLVSLMRSSRASQLLPHVPFTINILAKGQLDLAFQFAGMNSDPTDVEWDVSGATPRLTDAHAHFVCRPWRTYDGGDHVLVLGEVVDYAITDDTDPLVVHQGAWREML